MNDREFMDAMIAGSNPHHTPTTALGRLARSARADTAPVRATPVMLEGKDSGKPLSLSVSDSGSNFWNWVGLIVFLAAIFT